MQAVPPLHTIEEGGEPILWLATNSDLQSVTGKYFDQTTEARAIEQAYDEQVRRRLRDYTKNELKDYL